MAAVVGLRAQGSGFRIPGSQPHVVTSASATPTAHVALARGLCHGELSAFEMYVCTVVDIGASWVVAGWRWLEGVRCWW